MELRDFSRWLSGVGPGEIDTSALARFGRRFVHRSRAERQHYPSDADSLRSSDVYRSWWYYHMELLPGVVTKGIFPEWFPLLPRVLMRDVDVRGRACLDVGCMEGLVPTLLARRGSRYVLGVDASYGPFAHIKAVQHYHRVSFDFHEVGLMYDLDKKLSKLSPQGFDFINVSGLLYHVLSPAHVLASVRPLMRPDGLMLVSTNVLDVPEHSMKFNTAGSYQAEACTFWYLSIPMFDYLLAYFKLRPIATLRHAYGADDPARFVEGQPVSYASVLCRAVNDDSDARDDWMARSWQSVEFLNLCRLHRARRLRPSTIEFDGRTQHDRIDLVRELREGPSIDRARDERDTHFLGLNHQH